FFLFFRCAFTVIRRDCMFGVLLRLSSITNAMRSKPNFVLLMADDLGIGDIGCFGNDTIRTPNIDKLAIEGVKLTHHLAAAPVCTPSRAAFYTGRYPVRSGMDTSVGPRVLMTLGGSGGLPRNETTFAKILQTHGYSTGIIGKWHQGLNCETRNDHCHHPLSHGFHYFYGMPFTLVNECQPWSHSPFYARLSSYLGISKNFLICFVLFSFLFFLNWFIRYGLKQYWDCLVMRNHEIVQQPMDIQRTTLQILVEAHQFIERNKNTPFLLFVSLLQVHTPLVSTEKFIGKSKHGIYGDNVEEMDFMVGSVVDAIDHVGLKDNTLIYFTSDQGGHLEIKDGGSQTGGWNGIYRGGKGMAGWEGGIRVPAVIRWPNVIVPNSTIDEPTSLMDIYPTVVHLGGGELPNDRIIDGRSLVPLLKNQTSHSEHEFLFHYCGTNIHAVRWHQRESGAIWKAHYMTPVFYPEGAIGCYDIIICACEGKHVQIHNPPLLFELSSDPSEAKPLLPYSEPKYEAVISRIDLAVAEHQKTIITVPQQLAPLNNMWKFWIQPCCGKFPFCWCDEASSDQKS
uniref:Sulfatase N-terminal domain-containing protein n=1 Tax=Leptobrachium leishanense TaxID=445787 RepID=A0A8C5P9H0_9ANUR